MRQKKTRLLEDKKKLLVQLSNCRMNLVNQAVRNSELLQNEIIGEKLKDSLKNNPEKQLEPDRVNRTPFVRNRMLQAALPLAAILFIRFLLIKPDPKSPEASKNQQSSLAADNTPPVSQNTSKPSPSNYFPREYSPAQRFAPAASNKNSNSANDQAVLGLILTEAMRQQQQQYQSSGSGIQSLSQPYIPQQNFQFPIPQPGSNRSSQAESRSNKFNMGKPCTWCNGSGKDPKNDNPYSHCIHCSGKGRVIGDHHEIYNNYIREIPR
jgi:hypothetical protein